MGIFDIFKKKKAALTTDQKLDKMWDLWAINKLDLPCAKLMKYESEVNNGGHSQYFYNVANCGDLAVEVEAVLSMLPEPLREISHGDMRLFLRRTISPTMSMTSCLRNAMMYSTNTNN